LPRRPRDGLADGVTAGGGSVGIRVPDHPVAQPLLSAVGGPVAAPSANPSGRVSPTEAAHVLDRQTGLLGRIDAVLDGGPCPVGLESTIIGLTDGRARLLRPGGLPVEALEAALGAPLELPEALTTGPLEAPGRLASHYAPAALLRLAADAPREGEVWIGFGADPAGVVADRCVSLSAVGDLAEAAASLFAALRRADALAGPAGTIAVAPIPDRGLGRAINDRLRRAAAPRP
ncbi:MAG: Sua5/YciO/YrdC/YwlC family protein, partial [Pseudomonadota bacterium]